MTDATDQALQLADKWAQQIGDKMREAAPGAQDVAMEAVKVKIGSEVLQWLVLLVALAIAIKAVRFFIRRLTSCEGPVEGWFAGCIISGIVSTFLLAATIITLPSREIVGIFAPRGYVALMVLDAVKPPSHN